MYIDMRDSFELNDQQFPIASNFAMLDYRALLWVASGVYYGYPTNDIKIFYDNITDRAKNRQYEVVSGAGYVTYDKEYNRDTLLSYIKSNRYCRKPFPLPKSKGFFQEVKNNQQEIINLLYKDEDFAKKVFDLLWEITLRQDAEV